MTVLERLLLQSAGEEVAGFLGFHFIASRAGLQRSECGWQATASLDLECFFTDGRKVDSSASPDAGLLSPLLG